MDKGSLIFFVLPPEVIILKEGDILLRKAFTPCWSAGTKYSSDETFIPRRGGGTYM